MQRETGVALEYATYQLHQQIETANHTARARICQQQGEILENVPVQIQPCRFGLAHGDLYYQYNANLGLLRFWNCLTA